ncbi:MAG: phytanoyl-CoA dioxygenase family protein [Acidobacteriota bacterium]
MANTALNLPQLTREFEERGFVVLPNALSPAQVEGLNRALNHYLVEHPDEWVRFDESLVQTADVLPHTSEFDVSIENPLTLKVLEALIGPGISFEEFSMMIRYPTSRVEDIKGWHRDLTRDYARRLEIQAISLIYYLTDVTEQDHCFSIIPATHNRLVDMRPDEVVAGSEVDVTGPAGTAVLFHARCLHGGKLKAHSRERRTLHIYYSRADLARTSEWTRIPERLYSKTDPSLPPKLYSKWNVTDIFEGTGKRPKDIDPTLSTAEAVKEVQRRAKLTAQLR